jgi:tellurite resistance protein
MASALVARADSMVTADNRLRELASVLNLKVLPEAQ